MFGESRYLTSNNMRYYTIHRKPPRPQSFGGEGDFNGMKAKITLSIDATLVDEVREMSADRGISLNDFLCEQLRSTVGMRRSFQSARRRALARLRAGLDLRWTPPRSRADVHQR